MGNLRTPMENVSVVAGQASIKAETNGHKTRAFPLSYAQQRLWFLDQLELGTAAYIIPCAIRLEGELNRWALKRSLNEIVRRHETLRTSVVVHNGEPLQKIMPEIELAVEERDLRDIPADRRYDETKRVMHGMARSPFNLLYAPLIRVGLLQLDEKDHVLLAVMHHIVSDGWSIGIIIREFSQLYESYVRGSKTTLEELKIQYLDYTIWQRNWLKGERLEKQLAYWREQLADIPRLEWCGDYSRVGEGKHAGAAVDCKIPEMLTYELNQLGRREAVTLFMTLLAGFQLLLARYNGENDVAIGTPIAGRRSTETEALIGFFVNTLVIRTKLDLLLNFHSLLSQVRATTLAAYAHQDVPFEKVVEQLQPKRDLDRTPFFQAMFILQNVPQAAFELPGLKISEVEIELGAPKFDLKLTAIEVNGTIRGRLEYRADLFTEHGMRRLLGYWENLLTEIIRRPQEPIGNLSLLTESERQQVLAIWNDPGLESAQANVFDVFDEQAVQTPNAIAIEYGQQRVTYQQLRQQTDAIADKLTQAGVKPGELVLIFSADRRTIIEAMIGVLKAGCGFVSMLPDLPDQRIINLLTQCGPAWAILDPDLERRFEQLKFGPCQHICIAPNHESVNGPFFRRTRSGDELSYVFFTSGSTGKPKAIAGRLKGINHFISWEIEEFAIGPESRVAQLTSPMFDPVLRDVFVPLCSGGTACIPSDPDLVLSGTGLAHWLGQERISLMHTVPSVFRLMVNDSGACTFPALKHVLLAGEPVLPSDVGRWRTLVGAEGPRLVNLYGPSETTMVKFRYEVQEADCERRAISIGRPMKGAAAIAIDDVGAVCPPGTAGEIYIRTPYRSLGYYKQPDLTAKAFVRNPFCTDPEDVVYKTGDIGRILEDGNFMLLGRRDQQVKVRGVRIELGEIEAALSECDGVAAVAVVASEDDAGEKSLVAYVTAKSGAVVNGKDLRLSLKKNLPESMIPAGFMVLEEMPLTSNGKIDRNALPKPDDIQSGHDYVVPQTAEEEILCGIWASVLKQRQIGVEDNFFEIGGHSLLATKVIARISTVFGTELPLRSLFEHPTVSGLTQVLMQALGQGRKAAPKPLAREDKQAALPLSFAQQRLWFLEQMEPGNAAYNIPIALRLSGELDPQALRKSLEEIVRRHEVLRTVFVLNQDGEPVQRVRPATEVELQLEDIRLEHMPAQQKDAETRRLAEREAEQGFDLTREPLLRTKLIRTAEREHVLLVTMHHIVSDGWSAGIMVREFSRLYEVYVLGQESPLPELRIQYADYAAWQREWLQGALLEAQMAYWRKQLAGLEPLELPADHVRPAVMSQRGAAVEFGVTEEWTHKIKEMCQREGVTVFMGLLAGLTVVLSKYARQDDVVVGTPVANRRQEEVEGLIGFFVNTLVLRTKVRKELTFGELLKQVRARALEGYEHQDVPFEKVVEELQPERNLSRSPLFQVMLALGNTEQAELKMAGLELSGYEIHTRVAKFDLLLGLRERGGRIRGEASYARDLYEADTVKRLVRDVQSVLEEMVVGLEQRIGELSLLRGEEREQVLVEWNRTEVEYPQKLVHQLLEEQAERTPGEVAVECEGRRMSYEELNWRTNQLGHYLRKRGVGPEVRVGICLDRGPEMVVGVLGVLKAGGAYVPLDPGYPPERLRFMVEDAQTAVLLSQRHLEKEFSPSQAELVLLDDAGDEIEQCGRGRVESGVGAENLAYVIYTSGSTGQPKGVAMRHGVVAGLIHWELRKSPCPRASRTLQFASLSFDVSFQEIFVTLCAGGCLVLMSEDTRRNPFELWQVIREQRVETMFLPFVALQQLSEAASDTELSGLSLREIITAGEQLKITPALQKLLQRLPGCILENQYGPTESHVVTAYRIGSNPGEWVPLPPIGKPIANAQTYVLNEGYLPAPVGVEGELYLGGLQLARGYINRPELTAERFVPNPFGRDAGARMYKTGDKVRYRKNGDIEYLGRLDHQVKVRGYRIELGEIEAVLLEHASVEQVVVVARDRAELGKTLVAYLAGRRDSKKPSGSELREYLKARLPEYMVPSVLVVLDELPLTPNGKVDRKVLPESDWPEMAGDQERGQTAEEEILCGIFAGLLKRERVGVRENFFEAGGHSLLAAQVMARVRNAFAVELPLRALFEGPTARGLAERVKQARVGERELGPELVGAGREGELPLSFAQERLWFIDQLEPDSTSYNVPIGFWLTGTLNKEALKKSLNEIVRRHEVLRTVFPVHNGRAVQKIASEMPLVISEVDLSGTTTEERNTQAQIQARLEAEKPFDLSRGPLVRVKLLHISPDQHILLATMHHIVSDGWSMMVLQREFSLLYEAYVRGENSPLEDLKVQYADYALWQRNWLQGKVLEEQLQYWRKQLAEVTTLELPTDKPRPSILSESGADVMIEIDEQESGSLRKLARQENATLFMVLLAALDTLLWRYSGQNDIAVGTGIANRNRIETEGLIGFFVNTLVLRSGIQGRPSARELLNRVRQTTLEAYRYQDLPFEKVVEDLQPQRDLGRMPLFQVALVLQNFSQQQFSLPNLELSSFEPVQSAAKTELRFLLVDTGNKLSGTITYAIDLFEAETIARMADHWKHLLAEFALHFEQPLSQLSLMGEVERGQILESWSAGEQCEFWSGGIAALFARQASLTPDAPAVIWEEDRISYRDMARGVWQMGRYLHELGVRPETRVGTCLEPGAELMIAFFAVIAAGATYVPLDPDYPAERLGYMVEDTQPTVVLTKSSLQERLPPMHARRVYLDHEADTISACDAAVLDVDVSPDNVLYVIHTSGSTGRPKGVVVSQGAMVNRALFLAGKYQSHREDRSLQILSPSFDAFGGGLYSTLLTGGALVFTRPERLLSPQELCLVMEQQQVTTLRIPVGYLRELLSYALQKGITLPQSLRLIITGGETISRSEMRDWLKRAAPHTRFIHEYGPTETTITASLYEDDLHAKAPANPYRFLIGKPNANTRIYVLGEEMEPVATGVIGELYIGGASLARCYAGPSDQTIEKFVPDPISRNGERLYRTGDWGRWMADGTLEFLGRRDDQVKFRGYRIELGEIEAVLRQHPAIRDVAVILREDSHHGKRLVAYTIPNVKPTPRDAELRKFLEEKLPEYMVPNVFVELAEFPFTAGGNKLDRRKLPEPPEVVQAVQPPSTPTEEILCGIWSDLLKREQVGTDQNFFALGGHSLMATQVVARVRQVFGVELPLRVLFEAQTVAVLAERIDQCKQAGHIATNPPLRRVSRESPLPLSYAQQRLWFLDQLEPNSTAYNIPLGLRLRGELNVEALERALSEIVRRHEVLRTRFEIVDGEPRQVINPAQRSLMDFSLSLASGAPGDPLFEIRDISGMDDPEAELQQQVRHEGVLPFDLSTGPLLRVKLLRLGEQEHVLLVTMHHIISDGWSMRVWAKELSRLYEAYAQDKELELPELPLQYSDYAMWQRKWLQGEVLAEQVEHWREQLRGLEMLELPVDHRRAAEAGKRARKERFILGEDLTKKLRELSRGEGVTSFMTMLAGLQILLARYSGQEDIAVGVPIAGRNRSEIQEMIGFFVNTLVMRTKVSGSASVREMLRRVRKVALEAYDHQDVPFEKLVEELQPQRDLSRSPFFQVMLVMQNLPQAELKMGRLELEGLDPQEGGETKFDLSWGMVEKGERLAGEVDYAEGLFEEGTIQRMVVHLERVLERMAASREQEVKSIGLLTEREERQLAEEWNRTEREYGPEKTIVDLFEEQVLRRPDAVALEYERQEMSYAELNRRANQLGHYLRKHGVGPEVPVGICMERSFEIVVGLLGILKAGGAYLPLDPAYPHDRLVYLLKNSQVSVLLLQEQFHSQFLNFDGKAIAVDENWSEIAGESEVNPLKASGMENLVYVIYTSGSTGWPKGVMNVHGGLRNRLLWMQQEYRLNRTDRVLQKTPFTFDVSVWEFFWPLITGARLVIARPGGHHDPQYLSATIQSAQITTLHFVPAMLNAWLDSETAGHCPTLKRVICSGEALSLEVSKKFTPKFTAELHNLYGPTEASIDVTYWRCGEEANGDFVPIGKPIANTQVYVLDDTMQLLPVGVSGELFLGGIGLARGYLRRPDLTAERFVPNPFSDQGGQRLYRTGDRVRWNANGNLEFLGRLDFQVKVRGYRIELGEIEAVLSSHPGVREAAVVAKGDGADKWLVGYWVGIREAKVETEELKNYLREKLPAYMVPTILLELEMLPLSGNGKIDRKALPDPKVLRGAGDAACVLPRNEMEMAIAAIWQSVLHRDKVGIRDNFFDCGGHSLLATKLVTRIRNAFQIDLPVRSLFENPTVAGLVEHIRKQRQAQAGVAIPPITRVPREERLPLSFSQQRLWFFDQLESGKQAYNLSAVLRWRGELHIDVLSRAIEEIIRRHEVLRTNFVTTGGQPCQVISPSSRFPLRFGDLTSAPSEEREARVRDLAFDEVQRPFDLARGRLLRGALFKVKEDEHVLCLAVHHIVFDGGSIPVFIREIVLLYGAFLQNQPSPLPELDLQYADVAVWERTWLKGEALQHHLDYWRTRLEGCSQTLDLPTDFRRLSVHSFRGNAHGIRLSPELSRSLLHLGAGQGATEYMTLLALINIWLSYYSKQRDILVGTPVSNRNQIETEGMIGFFVNTLVFRTQVDAEARFVELLDRVRTNVLEDHAHHSLPFEMLVDELHIQRDSSRNPLFQMMFNMESPSDAKLELPGGVEIEFMKSGFVQSRYDLYIAAVPLVTGLELNCNYSSDLFRPATIEIMMASLAELIRLVVEDPRARVSELTTRLAQFERAQALARRREMSQQQIKGLHSVRRRTPADFVQ